MDLGPLLLPLNKAFYHFFLLINACILRVERKLLSNRTEVWCLHRHILFIYKLDGVKRDASTLFWYQIRLEGTLLNLLFGSLLNSHLSIPPLMFFPGLITVRQVLALRWSHRFSMHPIIVIFGQRQLGAKKAFLALFHFLDSQLDFMLTLGLLLNRIFPLQISIVELILILPGGFNLLRTLIVMWNTISVRLFERYLYFILLSVQKFIHPLLVEMLHVYFGWVIEVLDFPFLHGTAGLMLANFYKLILVAKRTFA